MAERGRPRTHGLQSTSILDREIMVVWYYNQSRRAGLKHWAAIQDAIAAVKTRHPKMRIGEILVKKILAKWQPRRSQTAWLVSKVPDEQLNGPEMERARAVFAMLRPGAQITGAYRVGIGPQPQHPGSNARQSL